MDSDSASKKLLVLGVHLKSEAYPNTLYRLNDMISSGLFEIEEINVPMWTHGTQNQHGLSRLTRNLWKAMSSHIAVLSRYMTRKHAPRVYIPYPSVFVLFMLSFLPRTKQRTHIVADVFISLYDTIVLDRHLLKAEGLMARLLKWMEKRAYSFADKLVVDTPQNQQFLSTLFGLPKSKFIAIPLSTDETNFVHRPYAPSVSLACKVLFIGTLVPLHGIGVILEAIRLLSAEPHIQFKLIGDGQDAHLIEAWQNKHGIKIEWERKWQSSSQLAEEIAGADICLGIFGAGDKTQRVCPFKIYAYASMGRPIITGHTNWLVDAIGNLPEEAIASVAVADAAALAAKIKHLASAPKQRSELAENGNTYYQERLTNQSALTLLAACILEAKPSA